jgi:UDP-glucose 4-epimerase
MILITGGAGYIATHTLISLNEGGYNFIVYDNLSNSSKIAIERVEKIINKSIIFEEGDIRDKITLNNIFQKYHIDSVIHFAGLKAVGESVNNPLRYYYNNVNGSISLLEVMQDNNCKKIVFSSSATVYGDPETTPIKEDFPVGIITNPYGKTKYFIEEILKDLYASDNSWKIVILRYFNPVGAHESGLIGEDPTGIPNNLMPFIAQTAIGKREALNVFGGDYDTIDGTGVRDYIHVMDLADGHTKAIKYLKELKREKESLTVNLGTGKGYSVLKMIKAYELASKKKIPYNIVERRAGDIAKCYADPTLAKIVLGWKAKKTLENMCVDSWKWQSNNLEGYGC